MKITVCIGSSCHLKGSRHVLESLQGLLAQYKVSEKVDLKGTFCMANCQNGVCVMIDKEVFSLTPETTHAFFEKNILTKL